MRLVTLLVCWSVLIPNYYATSGSIWFGHWYSHRRYSLLRGFHVLGHHALYPDSSDCLSEVFRAGSGWHDSTVALAPWLMLQLIVELELLPLPMFVWSLCEVILLMIAFSYVHLQFHMVRPILGRFKWFCRARRRHLLHHDADVNYMVVDHFWDRLFQTFVDRTASSSNVSRTVAPRQ